MTSLPTHVCHNAGVALHSTFEAFNHCKVCSNAALGIITRLGMTGNLIRRPPLLQPHLKDCSCCEQQLHLQFEQHGAVMVDMLSLLINGHGTVNCQDCRTMLCHVEKA